MLVVGMVVMALCFLGAIGLLCLLAFTPVGSSVDSLVLTYLVFLLGVIGLGLAVVLGVAAVVSCFFPSRR